MTSANIINQDRPRDDAALRYIGLGAAFLVGVLAGASRRRAALPGERAAAMDPSELSPPVKAASVGATVVGYPIGYIPLAWYLAKMLERKAEPAAQTIPLSAIGAWGTYHLLKSLVPRERPPASQGDSNHDRSFPSGHATAAAAVAFSAAYLWLKQDDARRALVLSAAIGAPLAIGASRVALGKHWPSDVVAGFAAGTAVAANIVANG